MLGKCYAQTLVLFSFFMLLDPLFQYVCVYVPVSVIVCECTGLHM